MLNNYTYYLKFLDQKLQKFFESQTPFIFCKEGCAHCCKNSQFPYSLTEMKYLLSAIETLEHDTITKIENNLQKTLDKKQKYRGKKFKYDCPFLINDKCSVYNYRGVICRTFGLMTNVEGVGIKAPFCSHKGLNYSNVLNLKKRTISPRKFKKLKTNKEPLGFNIGYKYLIDTAFEKEFGFQFGPVKPLIDWFDADNQTDLNIKN